MEKNIFYSWQSDLPNNKNRGFIQDCIEAAVKEIQQERIHLEIAIDRDTQGASGTPDIVATIFSKIEAANIFIADVSIINAGTEGRKTPNPNVLVELGFAAKSIGWENIICVFNSETGEVEELPFDLRFRRPLIYKIEDVSNKTKDRKMLAKQLQKEIRSIISKISERDELRNYLKQIIDKEVLSIINHINKIVFGYTDPLSSENIWKLLSMNLQQIEEPLFEKKFIGFTVLKEWEGHLRHLQETMNQPFFVHHSEASFTNAVIKIVKGLELITSICYQGKIFVDTTVKAEGYSVVKGTAMNPDNPKDHYLLLKNLEHDKGVVTDFGEIRPYNSDRVMNYQTINSDDFKRYTNVLHILISALGNWIKKTGKGIRIGPSHV
jgi:hypothetical protein